eukprot:scaffold15589_cov71-Attheya_sp.AAC.2
MSDASKFIYGMDVATSGAVMEFGDFPSKDGLGCSHGINAGSVGKMSVVSAAERVFKARVSIHTVNVVVIMRFRWGVSWPALKAYKDSPSPPTAQLLPQ